MFSLKLNVPFENVVFVFVNTPFNFVLPEIATLLPAPDILPFKVTLFKPIVASEVVAETSVVFPPTVTSLKFNAVEELSKTKPPLLFKLSFD